MGVTSSEHAVLAQRVVTAEEEISDFGRKLDAMDKLVRDGRELMAGIQVKLTIIAWTGGLLTTTAVAIFVKLLFEKK